MPASFTLLIKFTFTNFTFKWFCFQIQVFNSQFLTQTDISFLTSAKTTWTRSSTLWYPKTMAGKLVAIQSCTEIWMENLRDTYLPILSF